MYPITIVIVGFLVLEAANVVTLYFFPGSKMANGVGVFRAWDKSKQDPEIHEFVKYLVNWIAGTKLIFILLLIVILLTAQEQTVFFTGGALVVSIASFFWRLLPAIQKMDGDNQIAPKGYAATLGRMILAMLAALGAAILISAALR